MAAQERTNYPITLSVDDLGEGFSLVTQTDRRIDPRRLLGCLNTAVESLIEALEQGSHAPALSLSILSQAEAPAGDRSVQCDDSAVSGGIAHP